MVLWQGAKRWWRTIGARTAGGGLALGLVTAVAGCSKEELLTLGRTLSATSSAQEIDAALTVDTATFDTATIDTAIVDTLTIETVTADTRLSVDAAPPQLPLVFDTPALVPELYSETKDDNPTLTWDMLEIYFSSKRGDGATDLWRARRESVDEPFSEPVYLEEMSTPEFDTSPAIEGDGLTFWFSSVREDGTGGLDIIRVTRSTREEAWETATVVTELNSDKDDIPRPTGAGGLVMPLGSRRSGDIYATFLATRATLDEPFTVGAPVAELAPEGVLTADAFLTADGLTLLYTRGAPDEPADLYMATRAALSEPFGQVMALDSLNTDADERDPWLSPDGRTLYFASDRDGALAIYRATLL